MPDYRDYGIIVEEGASAPSIAVNTTRYTDVYKATHDGSGNRLSYAKRSFISFTYGGKHIEDFGVIAITEGDRLTHPAYADFTDIVSTPEVYDGQLYWDSHHKANTWEFKLATDAMTEENLTNFKNWFKPGVIRELILAEHANRAILARVAATPSISILPFEDNIKTTIGSTTYNVKTTLYKGEITLNFVMDYPFWYAKSTSYSIPNPDITYTDGNDYSGNFNVEDTLKIILEDNLPTGAHSNVPFVGDAVQNGVTIGNTPTYTYMYYAGNAPCHPIIEFDLVPRLNDTTGYIDSPHNSIASGGVNPYNYIRFESENQYDLNITTAGIYSSYNYARQILTDYAEGVSWEELRVAFRDNIKHYNARAYMMRLVDKYRSASSSEAVTAADVTGMKADMVDYLRASAGSSSLASAHYVIDCENGRATITVNHCTLTEDSTTTPHTWTTNYTSTEEDAGDMLKSSYLELEDRNYLTSNHTIGSWAVNHKYNYRISTNFPSLTNFKVSYKNMYY